MNFVRQVNPKKKELVGHDRLNCEPITTHTGTGTIPSSHFLGLKCFEKPPDDILFAFFLRDLKKNERVDDCAVSTLSPI